MRALVFDEPQARARLEGILHPMITQEVERATANAQGCYVVFVVPLLVESGRWRDRVDRICVVDCEPQTQVQRVQQRSRLNKHRIEQIMQAQATRQERLAVADDVIDNGAQTSCEALQTQVLGLHQQWCNLAK
jgi:dephospho-CoA kinase